MCGEGADGEGSGDALDGAADGFFERDGGRGGGGVDDGFVEVGAVSAGARREGDAGGEFELVFDEVGDNLGVGLGEEAMALGDECLLEGEVVFDDAVVDDDEGAAAVTVGMGVFFRRATVGGPAGVADAEAAVDGRVGDDGFEIADRKSVG